MDIAVHEYTQNLDMATKRHLDSIVEGNRRIINNNIEKAEIFNKYNVLYLGKKLKM